MQVQGNNEHKGEKWIDVLGWTQGEVEIEEDVRLSLLSYAVFLSRDRLLMSGVCETGLGDVQVPEQERRSLGQEGREGTRGVRQEVDAGARTKKRDRSRID